ncbi:ethanolamine ammonia-lyase subunit EutC [Paucibacter soli]|uniref:ethanolamine ammonia-lyase subunit EutC n=1 Tax=Paucibacter soli TaxID=3133433 RepID=UPI0030A84D77
MSRTPLDPWAELRHYTPARIALGRAGSSLPTRELLTFAAAHARARDAVHQALDLPALQASLQADGWASLRVASRAADRATYLRRPDLGRRLDAPSAERLEALGQAGADLLIVLGDGLSAQAVQAHALPLLRALLAALGGEFTLAPLLVASQARVALADEAGALLGARLALVLIGERPGLSSPDSLGAYLTHAPRLGCFDAQRNCISNIRPQGLAPELAALRLNWLLREALRRRLTGVGLKDESETLMLAR